MAMIERTQHMTTWPESEIVLHDRILIRKLADGTASPSEIQMLHDLQKRRVEMMRPKTIEKRRIPA